MNYYLYSYWNAHKYGFEVTHDPELDGGFLNSQGFKTVILAGPLPLGIAFYVLKLIMPTRQEMWFVGKPGFFARWNKHQSIPREIKTAFKNVNGLLNRLAQQRPLQFLQNKAVLEKPQMVKGSKQFEKPHMITGCKQFEKPQIVTDNKQFVEPEITEGLLKVLAGRMLLPSELVKALEENGVPFSEGLNDHLQLLYLQMKIEIYPAISIVKEGQFICGRCGQSTGIREIECIECGAPCFYCEECLMMGETKLCLPLYALPGGNTIAQDPVYPRETFLELDFTLTPAQRDASSDARDFVTGKRDEALVWAVCGAGKTEVAFGAIEEVLLRGGRVLFTIPRRDVVIELEPRLQKAFPEIKIACLYGGSSGKFQEARIIIATTHQVIRFYKAFDLVVLDEADAYPFVGTPMLNYALRRAKKEGGKLIYMTATPGRDLLAGIKTKRTRLIRIPARHHGYPLPQPVINLDQKLRHKADKLSLPTTVIDFLRDSLTEETQVFVFVPYINLTALAAKEIEEALGILTEGTVTWSHAKDPKRDEKREAFSKGKTRIFVTTSIMERGITVAKANVLVLFADRERIYDEGALVQMAGRAGRSTAWPCGKVWYVANRKTKAMELACRIINDMNVEAAKRGYLKETIK